LEISRKLINKHIPYKLIYETEDILLSDETKEPLWYNFEVKREQRRQRFKTRIETINSGYKTIQQAAREINIVQHSKTKEKFERL
jgi:hypothetical protein